MPCFDLSDFIIDAYITIGGTSLFYRLFFPLFGLLAGEIWLCKREGEPSKRGGERRAIEKREKKGKKKKREVMYRNLSLSPTV